MCAFTKGYINKILKLNIKFNCDWYCSSRDETWVLVDTTHKILFYTLHGKESYRLKVSMSFVRLFLGREYKQIRK